MKKTITTMIAVLAMSSIALSADNVRITGQIVQPDKDGSYVHVTGLGTVFLLGVWGNKGEMISYGCEQKGVYQLPNGSFIPAYKKAVKGSKNTTVR
jgi:hypothetical protein